MSRLHPDRVKWEMLWATMDMRAEYLPYLRATIELLLVPPELRNHAAPQPPPRQEGDRQR